jgi:hypothetical protein
MLAPVSFSSGAAILAVLWLQPAAAVVFTMFRALLFTFVGSFNTVVFGPKSVGRIAGVVYTSTAGFILLQTALISFTSKELGNNYLPMHLLDVSIVVIPIVMTFWVSRRSMEVGVPASRATPTTTSVE